MFKATVMNAVQGIQKVLEKYLGNRKAAKDAIELPVIMQGETQHSHNGEVFFVHKDEAGNLVLTMKSLFETIKIPGSDSPIYSELLKHHPTTFKDKRFIDNLKEAISKPIKDFEVFANDPSMDNGKLQFVPGFKPAVGCSYNEWEEIAEVNGLRLGTKDEYILFLGWLITGLINEGWSERDAWFAVCTNSKELGHYWDSADAKNDFEPTGSRRIVGKCDLANTRKILAKDEKAGGFWLAGGVCNLSGSYGPLANLNLGDYYDYHANDSVGWFVL